MKSLLHHLNTIAGSAEQFDMQQRIFHCAIAISIVTFIPAGIFLSLQPGGWFAGVGILLYTLLYCLIYWIARSQQQLQKAVLLFSLVGGSILNIGWVIDHGQSGSAAYFLFVVLLMIIFTAEKPVRYVIAVAINIFIISLVDEQLQAMINWQTPISKIGQTSALVTAMSYVAVLALMYRGLIHQKIDSTVVEVIQQLEQQSIVVSNSAHLINDRGDDLLDSTLKQTAAIEQLSATTEELNATAEQNSSLTSKAMLSLKDSEQYLDISRNKLEQLSSAIAQIRHSSGEIQNIINVINDISYQTNLLSLNAMIEASRGSDNGGFKVVALEVKKLAERSSDAAANINKLLKANFTAVQEGVELAEAMQLGFNDIQNNNKPLVATFQNVSDASEEQRQAIRQIAIGLNEISLTVEQNKLQAEGSANAAAELQDNAQALQRLVLQLQQSIEQ